MAAHGVLLPEKDTTSLSDSGPPDPEPASSPPSPTTSTTHIDPANWPPHRKWTITSLCCLVTFLTGWNATALTAATSKTNAHFAISDATFPHSVWAVTTWNLGAALAPMLVLPVMEEHGTRPGYLSVYALFLLFVVPQGVTCHYATFCGVRLVAGCCAGVLQTCMDGVIADVWRDNVKMSRPVSCYVGALLSGVSSGPVFGAVVTGPEAWALGWKWIVWLQVIIYGVVFIPVLLIVKETRLPVVLAAAAAREQPEAKVIIEKQRPSSHTPTNHDRVASLLAFLRGNILRPFRLLLTEPVVFSFTLLSALSYGITFISTQSIPQVYRTTYHFPEPSTGYIQASVVLGELAGWALCLCAQDLFFSRQSTAAHLDPTGRLLRKLPEKRLYAAIPASFLALAAGLFVYGFAAKPHVSLYWPTLGLFLVGLGVVVVMQAIMMYVTDAYARYAASASAAVCFGENVFAAFLPLGSMGMYSRLGFGGASALLGAVAVVLGLAPVVLVWRGEGVRRRSPFMQVAGYG